MASLKKRGKTYYVQYYVGGKAKRRSLETASLQIAKEKLRQFESAQFRGDDLALPTRTPIADVVRDYVEHIKAVKTERSVRADLYYVRQWFGPVCDDLKPVRPVGKPIPPLEANYFEEIATQQIAAFLTRAQRERNYEPKTVMRYREVVMRVFNWAMAHRGIRMPRDSNPAKLVARP